MNHTFATVDQLSEFDTVIDARSPAEFALDHIPGAINCPVLDDNERIRVGTLYKQVSPFEARKLGAVLVARNVARHIEEQLATHGKSWRPLVYCWRGGQRSGAFTHILKEVGWSARRLTGGYKAWRHHVMEGLESVPARLRFQVLAGPTGCGKTKVLEALQAQGHQVLNLEALAAHKGSVLGDIPGQVQPSQKKFETLVFSVLSGFDSARPVFVEAESKRIGQLRLPPVVFQSIQDGRWVGIDAPVDLRVAFLLRDYDYLLSSAELGRYLDRLVESCGKVLIDQWKGLIQSGNYSALVSELLRTHYDKHYARSMAHVRTQDAARKNFVADDLSVHGVERLARDIAQGV